jgi:quercetin dioxygenase-like cupin family protein
VSTLDSVKARPGDKLSFFGMELVWLITPEQTRNRFFQVLHLSPPATGVPMHIHHGEEEAIYVLEGQLVAQIGDEVVTAGPGDAVMLPKGAKHGWRVTGNRTARIVFTFDVTPECDYETMFASLVGLQPDEVDRLVAICAANNIEMLTPPALP